MKKSAIILLTAVALATLLGVMASAAAAAVTIYDYAVPGVTYSWQVVVNNGDKVPGDTRAFNSYNQPSLNVGGLVVFRGRSKGGSGGEPAHGVFVRDLAAGTEVTTILDRKTQVPQPNNLGSTFIEPPSFPRIDMWSDTVATRGNHQPVWNYDVGTDPVTGEPIETRAGTTGVYTDPFGSLIAGASNLGAVPDFDFFAVPGIAPAIKFDVFPGAPAVTDGATVVFKGNFTEDGVGKTGVYYRDLADVPIALLDGTELRPAGGMGPVVRIADTSTLIPGYKVPFGSTAPPSAAGRKAVFAGFDNEESPTKGGIYLAQLTGPDPKLKVLVRIGQQVPGEKSSAKFNRIGEGLSYDGRFVAFWGAWGTETKTLVLQCPTDGNKDRIAYCKSQNPDGYETKTLVLQCPTDGNKDRIAYCKSLYPNGYTTTVPKYQGIFVYDTVNETLTAVAKTPANFADFVYWNFSGKVPGSSEGDDGEPARWRSTAFVAVSGLVDGSIKDAAYHVAFKARQGDLVGGAYVDAVDGIYLRKGPSSKTKIAAVVETGMPGTAIDPEAIDPLTGGVLPVTAMGVERDGFRGDALAVTVSMGTEAAGWAGVYLTRVPAALR